MSQTELLIGDVAPHFPTLEFIKGQSISSFETGQIYVLECWASWCKPCIETIPHLTELQKKYPQITVLGVAVWEENIEDVHQFVTDMGDKMNYRIAFNTVGPNEKEGDIPLHWLRPAGQDGIPTAFIIDQYGKVAWFGHPADIDSVLDEIVNNEFDIIKAAKDYREYLDKNQVRERKQLEKILNRLLSENDISAAIEACNVAFADNANLEQLMGIEKLNLLIKLNKGLDALNYAKYLVEITKADDAAELQTIGNIIADALEQDTEIDERFTLLDYAVSILSQADRLTQSSENYRLKCTIARSLTVALLAREKPQDALKYAELGLDYTIKAGFPESVQHLFTDFVARCSAQITTAEDTTTTTPDGRKIICDGDSCRIE